MTDKPPRYIVAEISKNWPESDDVLTTGAMPDPPPRLLSERFEAVCNHNWEKGYKLVSWKLNRLYDKDYDTMNDTMNETIIAVFELWRHN